MIFCMKPLAQLWVVFCLKLAVQYQIHNHKLRNDCGCSSWDDLIMDSSITLPDALRKFIDLSQWTFAKTMPEWPHEYIVRDRADENLFVQLVRFIRTNGYEGKFYRKSITYFKDNGLVYWTMGAPIIETTIINRCRIVDSYEYRLLNDLLPETK
jgi:hypothetical protein